ncbi:MAG: hypothetical protein HYV16_08785 [Gammaproteobacteria bacterium]|nr:hypothetical protein [Gammaproteobacteria bacterium]
MDTCKYHPAQTASWHCPRCAMNLCTACVIQDERSALPKCTLCRGDVHTLGISQVVTPFWQRLPAFFAYGFQGSALKFTLGMTAATVLASLLPVIGMFLLIAICAVAVRYLFAITERTAQGELEPPSVSQVAGGGGYGILFKQLAVFLFLGLLVGGVMSTFGQGAGLAVYIFAILGYPASTMLLAATGSFRQAVNPIAIVEVMRGIGWPYVILYAFLILLSFSSFWVLGFVLAVLPLWLAAPAAMAVSLYFSVLMFNMMGYALYQYHHELGLPIRREVVLRNLSPVRAETAKPAVSNALAEADVMIKEGRYEQALQALQSALNQDLDNVDAAVKRYQLLLAMGKSDAALATLDELFQTLLAKRQGRRALALLREALGKNPDYRPGRGEHAHALAREAHHAKDDRLALRLLLNLHKRYPGFGEVPKAYLLAAHILSERLKDDAQAMRLLEFVDAHYPQAPEAEEVAIYLKALRAVSGIPGTVG